MLVLTRKLGERIHIGDDIVVTVNRIQGDKVRLGIEAPPHVPVHREEVHQRAQGEHPPLAVPSAAEGAGAEVETGAESIGLGHP